MIWAGLFGVAWGQWVVTLPAVSKVIEPMVGPVEVLLPPGQSPHHWALRPSQLKALDQAEGVVMVSPVLEQPVFHWLSAHGQQEKALIWSRLEGVRLLTGGHDHHHDDEMDTVHINPHLWLSPHNAEVLMTAVGHQAKVAPERVRQLQMQLAQTVTQVHQLLAPVRQRPFLVWHDAFAYFEHDFGLHKAGVIELGANGHVGLKRLLAMRARIEQDGIRCIVYPSHASPKLLKRLTKGLDVRLQPLDALGWRQASYVDWLISLAKGYRACLTY